MTLLVSCAPEQPECSCYRPNRCFSIRTATQLPSLPPSGAARPWRGPALRRQGRGLYTLCPLPWAGPRGASRGTEHPGEPRVERGRAMARAAGRQVGYEVPGKAESPGVRGAAPAGRTCESARACRWGGGASGGTASLRTDTAWGPGSALGSVSPQRRWASGRGRRRRPPLPPPPRCPASSLRRAGGRLLGQGGREAERG